MENIKQVLHAGITVNNMDESIAWYEKNLGFKVKVDRGIVPGLNTRIVFIKKDNFEIELFEPINKKPIPENRLIPNEDIQTVGTKHIAFKVTDMEGLKEKYIENNVDIASEVKIAGNNVMFIRDCNGVLIELIESA